MPGDVHSVAGQTPEQKERPMYVDIRSNLTAGKDTATQPGTVVDVGSASTPVVAANPDRVELTIVNDSADAIYLRLAGTGAALNSGIRLNAGGGSYTTTHYRGAISAIQADTLATRRLLVAEV